jgi:peptidoglycan/LPS O-acetylase OafA/YrhL
LLEGNPAPVSVGTSRNANNFDFLRFLFATLVILSHSYYLTGKPKLEPFSQLTLGQSFFGEISVNSFFVISGYLITASWLKSTGVWNYLEKRILRIYPAFIVVSILCLALVGPVLSISSHYYFHNVNVLKFAFQTLLLDKFSVPVVSYNFRSPVDVNGSLWTIKIEFECYLMVIAFGLAGLFKKPAFALSLLVGSGVLYAFGLLHGGSHFGFATMVHLRFFYFYLAGMVFYLYREKIQYKPAIVAGVLVAAVVTAVLRRFEVFMPLELPYLLMAVACGKHIPFDWLSKRCDLSYGLYLYAWPIQMLLLLALGARVSPIALFAMTFPLSALAAIISWIAIERPSMMLKSRLPQKAIAAS